MLVVDCREKKDLGIALVVDAGAGLRVIVLEPQSLRPFDPFFVGKLVRAFGNNPDVSLEKPFRQVSEPSERQEHVLVDRT